MGGRSAGAALSIDSPMTWDDFFHHLFTDTGEDLRGEPVICLRLELLPVLLQRAVVAAEPGCSPATQHVHVSAEKGGAGSWVLTTRW